MCIEYLQTNYEYCQYRPSRIRIVQSSPVQSSPTHFFVACHFMYTNNHTEQTEWAQFIYSVNFPIGHSNICHIYNANRLALCVVYPIVAGGQTTRRRPLEPFSWIIANYININRMWRHINIIAWHG